MIDLRLDVRMTVTGPVLSRSTLVGAAGVDAPAARDANGRPIHPASQIKGLLREALADLAAIDRGFIDAAAGSHGDPGEDAVERLLGPPPSSEEEKEPDLKTAPPPIQRRRGLLRFTDFVATSKPEAGSGAETDGGGQRTPYAIRIKRDSNRRAAEDRHMLLLEDPFGPNTKVELHGTVEAIAADEQHAKAIETAVGAGLRWVTSVGAFRSVGFGAVEEVEVVRKPSASPQPTQVSPLPVAPRYSLVLRFSDPFCIAERRLTPNLFASSEIVSGAVMKGALASLLNLHSGRPPEAPIEGQSLPRTPTLAKCFGQLRVLHALPSPKGSRPVVPPRSIVRRGRAGGNDKEWFDVALSTGPLLLRDPLQSAAPGRLAAPEFEVDWKGASHGLIRSDFDWGSLQRTLRVRTSIDPKTRRAATGRLFGYEMVVPKWADPALSDEPAWYGEIDLGSLDAGALSQAVKELGEVLGVVDGRSGRLPNIGKSKVTARLELAPIAGQRAAPSVQQGQMIVVSLQSEALLCANDDADGSKVADVWREISGNSLSLVRHFARQHLVGQYLGRRAGDGQGYMPYLLTEAGSVFVLKVEDAAGATKMLQRWLDHGLDVPAWAKALHLDDWRRCPFQPQNGFGEINIDLPCHRDRQPGAGEFEEVTS